MYALFSKYGLPSGSKRRVGLPKSSGRLVLSQNGEHNFLVGQFFFKEKRSRGFRPNEKVEVFRRFVDSETGITSERFLYVGLIPFLVLRNIGLDQSERQGFWMFGLTSLVD